jgi:hypothetical protein
MNRRIIKDVVQDQIIGVAKVDLSNLIYVENMQVISGYFHIFNYKDAEKVKDSATQTLKHVAAK